MICDFSILRELRKLHQLSIADLSAQSGVSASVISKLERNQTAGEMETCFRLARVFGLTLSDLISLAENRTSHRTAAKNYKLSQKRGQPFGCPLFNDHSHPKRNDKPHPCDN